jgi:hypothetical protein
LCFFAALLHQVVFLGGGGLLKWLLAADKNTPFFWQCCG